MTRSARTLALFALPALVGGCAIIPDPTPPASIALPLGSAAALGEPVKVGSVTATPIAVVEDSRCPAGTQCVWAGRLVVRTQIDGAGWRETSDLTLGEPFGTHGVVLALTSGNPAPQSRREVAKEEYRFLYEAR